MTDLLKQTSKETPEFLEQLPNLGEKERRDRMIALTAAYKELINDGHGKVALATEMFDVVERHIRRLDDDLIKFEEEQMTGTLNVFTLGPKLVSTRPANADFKYEKSSYTTSANRPRRGTS